MRRLHTLGDCMLSVMPAEWRHRPARSATSSRDSPTMTRGGMRLRTSQTNQHHGKKSVRARHSAQRRFGSPRPGVDLGCGSPRGGDLSKSGSAWLGRSQKDGLPSRSWGQPYVSTGLRPSTRAQGRGSLVAAPFKSRPSGLGLVVGPVIGTGRYVSCGRDAVALGPEGL
jgi:hypothetical protein